MNSAGHIYDVVINPPSNKIFLSLMRYKELNHMSVMLLISKGGQEFVPREIPTQPTTESLIAFMDEGTVK